MQGLHYSMMYPELDAFIGNEYFVVEASTITSLLSAGRTVMATIVVAWITEGIYPFSVVLPDGSTLGALVPVPSAVGTQAAIRLLDVAMILSTGHGLSVSWSGQDVGALDGLHDSVRHGSETIEGDDDLRSE